MNLLKKRGTKPEAKTPDRVILAVLSDTHGGHRHGLMDPAVIFEEIGPEGEIVYRSPDVTPAQEKLWQLHTTNIEYVDRLAGKDEIAVIHNGEACMGNKHKNELVSTRDEDQITIGAANLRPLIALPQVKIARLTIGTEAHQFDEGMADIVVGKRLRYMFPDKDIKAIYHGLASFGGAVVDYSHHGPFPGSRNWLKGNEARYYLRSLMTDYLAEGARPPDLVLRAHYHEYIEESLTVKVNGTFYTSHLVVTPSMMMMTGHARKVTKSSPRVTNGWVAFEVVGGILQWPPHRMLRTFDIRTKERL